MHRGRLYRFDVEYCRSSYDLDAVLAAANEALADAGEPKRFVILGISSPHDVMIAFCNPATLEPIAQELGLKPSVRSALFVDSVTRLGDPSRHSV